MLNLTALLGFSSCAFAFLSGFASYYLLSLLKRHLGRSYLFWNFIIFLLIADVCTVSAVQHLDSLLRELF